ncbi:MAG: FAD-dependent oxidoreductase [Verrucomicrobiia bacterium]
MNGEKTAHVIVIGAGIAGLAAAYYLRKAGLQVTVLEKENRVGGRMTTVRHNGMVIDCGAQFLSTAYLVLPGLARELGLSEWVKASPYVAVSHKQRLRQLKSGHPLSPVSSGLLDPLSWFRLGYHLWRMKRGIGRLSLTDYGDWHGFDDEDGRLWSLQHFGGQATDDLLEPIHHGLYFQGLSGNSRALLLAVMAFGFRRPVTVTVPGGMGVIPEALARVVPVTLNCAVKAVRVNDNRVLVVTDQAQFEGDYVILATTASVAARLYSDADPLERALMATPYNATINIAIATAPDHRIPAGLANVYGILFAQSDHRRLAAIAIERNKSPDRVAGGELFDVMLDNDAAREAMPLSDDTILARVIPELEAYFPGLSKRVAWARVMRWPEAIPQSPVGRSRSVHQYRHEKRRERKVYLAGDYMGFPWTDSAAATGIWAANQILHNSDPYGPGIAKCDQQTTYR